MQNIKRPELFRVTFTFSITSLFLASTVAVTFNYISLFFALGPSSGLVTAFLVDARLILKTPAESSDIISLKHCLECVFSG